MIAGQCPGASVVPKIRAFLDGAYGVSLQYHRPLLKHDAAAAPATDEESARGLRSQRPWRADKGKSLVMASLAVVV
ncbi:hypothetical protein AB0897_35425, partial [Streptomyces sp. NPDC007168]|uniref:hypothetical protein n=1 Tax=Streptomyces sp. NPDC007168 TaxID=3156919 RepID=UPI0034534BB5